MITFPILITLYAGFSHAFETDHLLAVGNIVTRRNQIRLSLKDGVYWGLGHTSTILLVGLFVLLLKANVSESVFRMFEAVVGFMLISLGVARLWKHYSGVLKSHTHSHIHGIDERRQHTLAYSIGLVHGLAGSGVLMVLVMTEMQSSLQGILYLITFGFGSVAGMALAAGLFSTPFSKKFMQWKSLHIVLLILSCVLCVLYGGKIMYDNIFG